MSLSDYPTSELEPRLLTKEERADPYLVIHNFFSCSHLPEVREALWEWVKLTVTSSYHNYSRRDKANLVYLYEKIQQLVEAAHIIHQRTKKRPL